jgi:hypothetical protein
MGSGFFNTRPPRESEPSRPKYVNPRTGEVQSWQRASNFAAPLDNPFGLTRHHGRQIVRGFNVRADLARMALTGAIDGDKVDEVITTALTAAESEAKANNGTAVHAALQLCDTGADVPEEYWPHARGYVAELKRWGLRPVAVEQRILNTRLGATGSFDRVYVTDSGRYLIGDIKTGRVDHAHKFAVQCEVYAGADFVVHETGGASTAEPIPWNLDQDAALLIHVDPDTGATAVYEVPLRVARWGAALAEQVRAFQRTDVLLPYSGAPSGPLAEQLRREAVQAADGGTVQHEMRTPAQIGVPNAEPVQQQAQAALVPTTAGAAPVTPSGVAAPAHVQPAESSTVPTSGAVTASPSDAPLTEVEIEAARKLKIELDDPVHVRRMLALLVTKNDKAKLQRMLSDLGGTDLAHNRKWLAERIIAAQDGTSGSATAVAQTIEQGVPAGEATPFLLKQLADAATVDDIERIRANVISMSGEAAWTSAMNEVAVTRAAELMSTPRSAPPDAPLPAGSPLTRIADAKSTQDLARVWEDVTRNGAEVNAWTPAYDKAARERGAALQASAPANPNPWGNA